jgi:hypothetical protein
VAGSLFSCVSPATGFGGKREEKSEPSTLETLPIQSALNWWYWRAIGMSRAAGCQESEIGPRFIMDLNSFR